MRHAAFQDPYRTFGSGKDFLRVLVLHHANMSV